MKRTVISLILLIALGIFVTVSGRKVRATILSLDEAISAAFSFSLQEEYPQCREAFLAASLQSQQDRRFLELFVRRSLLDKLTETLATLPEYAVADNQADLAMETARAHEQLRQILETFQARF